ncbi:MAG TPA: amidophosphoribosyltransferase [Candidatus Paceibacterota bacterium]
MCGIFGLVSAKAEPQLPDWVFFGLSHLQHRGQESAGVAYSDGEVVGIKKNYGFVSQVFTSDTIKEMVSHKPIIIAGQTWYSTSVGKSKRNIPPQYLDINMVGRVALFHNGNIPNVEDKIKELEKKGVVFNRGSSESANDTEYMLRKIVWLIEENNLEPVEAIKEFMCSTNGSYSCALLFPDKILIFTDPWKNRPLFWAESDGIFFFASETCALNDHSEIIRKVDPGQIIELKPGRKPKITHGSKKTPLAQCVFERIYFSRPDSQTFGKEDEESFRNRLGRESAELFPVDNADLISYIPESGAPAAEGFSEKSGKPLRRIYVRNPYLRGRGFINPTPKDRETYSKWKYHLLRKKVKGKIIVLVDDSIVRAITLKGKVKQLKKSGAKEVHIRISAPAIIKPCYYGIDFPTEKELIAPSRSEEEIRYFLDADSLKFLPVDSLKKVINEGKEDSQNYCQACFTGEYPIPLH